MVRCTEHVGQNRTSFGHESPRKRQRRRVPRLLVRRYSSEYRCRSGFQSLNVQDVDPIISQLADHAIKQTRQLATKLLETGMMEGSDPQVIAAVVNALTSRQSG